MAGVTNLKNGSGVADGISVDVGGKRLRLQAESTRQAIKPIPKEANFRFIPRFYIFYAGLCVIQTGHVYTLLSWG